MRGRAKGNKRPLLWSFAIAVLVHLMLLLILYEVPGVQVSPLKFRRPLSTTGWSATDRSLALERDMSSTRADAPELPAIPQRQSLVSPVVNPDEPEIWLTARVADRLGGKPRQFVSLPDSTPTMAEMDLSSFIRGLEDRGSYTRPDLPDARSSDSDQGTLLARRVVQRAIEAMGGASALARLNHMSLTNVIQVDQAERRRLVSVGLLTEAELQDEMVGDHQWYRRRGLLRQFAQTLPGGARAVWDGERGHLLVADASTPLSGDSLVALQRRAERWDFLSRYAGDGVRLRWIGAHRASDARLYDLIEVDDRRFGRTSFRAWFDRGTGLLRAEETPVEEPHTRRTFHDYRVEDEALLWHLTVTERSGRGTDSAIVSYDDTPDSVFLSSTSSPPLALGSRSSATLWIDTEWRGVSYSGESAIAHELPGQSGVLTRSSQADTYRDHLTASQRTRVAVQLAAAATQVARERALFAQVRSPIDEEQVEIGDLVLRVLPLPKRAPAELRTRVFYGAEAFVEERDRRRRIVRDGPVPDGYFGVVWGGTLSDPELSRVHRDCVFYRLPIYTVASDGAYVSGRKLQELLRRTLDKVERALADTVATPSRYDNRCCYCASP